MSGASLFGMDEVRSVAPVTGEEAGRPSPDSAAARPAAARPWWARLAAMLTGTAPADPATVASAGGPAEPSPLPTRAPATPPAAALAAPHAEALPTPVPPALTPRTPWAVRLDPARGID